MKFFSKIKDLAVISKRTKKVIARFKGGEFETKDTVMIDKMKPLFKNDGTDFKSLNYMKLRKIATGKGIKADFKKKVDLVAALERSERYG